MASVQIVAEIGTNYTPLNLGSAKKMIQVAANCGADLVKFQAFDVSRMSRPKSWKEKSKPWQLDRRWHPKLKEHAEYFEVGYFVSVFDLFSLAQAMNHIPIIKIAASEIGNQKLLRGINDLERKVYLSVDYRKIGAVVPALTWLPDCAVTLLYCVSDYPAELPPLDGFCNLQNYGLPVGWSSHVPYPDAITAVETYVLRGAKVVELHLRTGQTPKNAPDNGPWSLYPEEFTEVVKAVRDVG